MKPLFAFTAVLVAIVVAAPTSLAAAKPQGGVTLITDTMGGNGHPKRVQQQGYALITDTLGGNGGAVQTTTVFRDPGFSWTDAGIGAAVVAGSLLVALGGVRVMQRRRAGFAV
jgi:hypothetical protein